MLRSDLDDAARALLPGLDVANGEYLAGLHDLGEKNQGAVSVDDGRGRFLGELLVIGRIAAYTDLDGEQDALAAPLRD